MKGFLFQILAACVISTSQAVTADDLEMRVDRSERGLQLSCFVTIGQPSNFIQMNNLIISKQSNGSTQVLATVSSYYGHRNPISHIPNAQVSGTLSSGEKPQGSLRLLWVDPDSSLDGRYVCELHGVDANFMPKIISKFLPVEIGAMCPCFGAEPEVVRFGLTKTLEISCFLPNPSTFGVSELAMLVIIKEVDGVKQVVAEVNLLFGTILHHEASNAVINGSLSRNVTFLTVKWDYPTSDMAGEYTCEGSGVGTGRNSVYFNKQLSVISSEPSREELVEHLLEMYKVEREYLQCKEALSNVTNAGTSTIAPLATVANTTVI